MTNKDKPSFTCTVYVAGQLSRAEDALRELCTKDAFCVTLTPTRFIYRHGAEDGVAVGLTPHPRFDPETPNVVHLRARRVALYLMACLHQRSAMVVTPNNTEWIGADNADGEGVKV